MFQCVIGNNNLECVDVINDLSILVDNSMNINMVE
jgi:hypothetical protein